MAKYTTKQPLRVVRGGDAESAPAGARLIGGQRTEAEDGTITRTGPCLISTVETGTFSLSDRDLKRQENRPLRGFLKRGLATKG